MRHWARVVAVGTAPLDKGRVSTSERNSKSKSLSRLELVSVLCDNSA